MAQAPTRVLFVDDDASLRDLARHDLGKAGMTVTLAGNGHEGLDQLARAVFDAVVVDIIMPEKEGLETIIEIRKRWPRLPVIAISGGGRMGSNAFLSTARAFGAHAVMAKPFAMAELAVVIQDHLAVADEQKAAGTDAETGANR
jgi:CheY-like chemotaxis protein